MTWATTVTAAPMQPGLLPALRPGWVGMLAAWDAEEALDRLGEAQPRAAALAAGWELRMRPLRVSGAWAALPGLPRRPLPAAEEGPVAALTLGRPRPHRLLPFLRAAAKAEAAALDDERQLFTIALARPPGLVSTFSLWRDTAAMKSYAYEAAGSHRAAVEADRERPFHHESAFIRLAPYASRGSWGGADPLARAQPESALNL